jgi:propanediol utilization protein
MSDVYSRVHWAHNPNGSIGDRVSGQIIKLSQQEFDEIFGEEKPIPKKDRILN